MVWSRLLGLGEQRTLSCSRSGGTTAAAAQHERDEGCCGSAGDRSRHVDEVVGELSSDQVWTERAGRVHRGARDRASPKSGESDVAADAERAKQADVLRTRGGAQNNA